MARLTLKNTLEVIKSALDCSSHFHKPIIVNNDDYFTYGKCW